MDRAKETALDELTELKRRLAEAEAKLSAFSQIESNHGTELALPISEVHYRTLFDNMTEGFALHEIICDEQGKPCDYRFLEVNAAFERQTGLRRDDIVGRRATEVLPGLEQFWIDTYGEVALTGRPVQFDHYTQTLDRHYRVFAYSFGPEKFAVLFLDISDKKQAEEKLAYLASFPQRNPSPVIEVDLEGKIHYANPASQQLFPDLMERGITHEWLSDWDSIVQHFHQEQTGVLVRDVCVGIHTYQQTLFFLGEEAMVRIYGIDFTERKQYEESLRQSEQRLSRSQEMSHLGSWELDLVTNVLSWSDEIYRIFAYTPQEFGATYEAFLEAVHPDDRAAVDAAYSTSISEGRDTYEIEHRLVRKSTGEVRYVHEKCVHIRDGSGRIIRSEGMVHDITESKLIDQALRRARDDLEMRVYERTQALKITLDHLQEEISQREKMQAELESNVQELQVIEEELRNNNEMLLDTQKVLETERKRFQDLFDFAPDGYLVTDTTGQVVEANQAATRLLHISHLNLIGKPLMVFIDPNDHPIFCHLLNTFRGERGVQSLELRIRPRKGPRLTTAVTVATAKDLWGKDTLRWTVRDITEGKKAEEIIKRNSLRNAVLSEVSQSLAEASLDEKAILDIVAETIARLVGDSCAISLASEDGKWLNPVAWSHRRAEAAQLMGSLFAPDTHPVTEGPSGRVYQTSQPLLVPRVEAPLTPEYISPTFRLYAEQVGITSTLIVPLQMGSKTIGTLGVSRDSGGTAYNTEDQTLMEVLADRTVQALNNARLYHELQVALQNELETHDQLVQSEKFAAVGRLLASITHEINNPLQTIKNCLYLSQMDTGTDSPVAEYLRMATAETDRLSNLVAQLREVYRPPTHGRYKMVEIPALVGEVHTLLAGYLQEKHVTWQVNPPQEGMFSGLVVEGVPDQLKQVFLNLALNASDAMEPLGGTITIDFKLSADGCQAGVSFSDNGPGLPEGVKNKLFEPFVTTKEKGLGLGLVICYDIIQKHNGRIEVQSEPGQGAAFTIWLPARSEAG